jgi:hypothetical protein
MDRLQSDIRAAFERQQAGLGTPLEAQARVLHSALTKASTRRKLLPQMAAAAATLVVAGTIAAAVVFLHSHVRPKPSTQANSIELALSSGAPAAIGSASDRAFVWLTGLITTPGQGGSAQVTGVNVEVLDWTGTVRYHFQLPHPTQQVPMAIQTISADGTRALLDDGTVLDQTGAVVGKIPALAIAGMPGNTTRWMGDDSGVCAANSNEPVAPYVAMPPKGQGTPPPRTLPPSALAGADHSVTLKVYGLDGHVRTIATVGKGPLGITSGFFGDSAGVLSCSPSTDLAVVARYHDADINPADQSSTNMTVSLWAIKLSTGATLFNSPETRMALGATFIGSANGQLALEHLWNSQVWGSQTDVVLQMPSGHPVPVLDAEPIPDTPGLSADGTRILRRLVEQPVGGNTDLELIDASDGRIIRRVVIPTLVGASAVAEPGGSSFMVQVENYLALVDGNGGITLLHPDVNLGGSSSGIGGSNSVGLTWSGVQG